MNRRYSLPLEQFEGRTPNPVAIYRPAGIFGSDLAIPAMLATLLGIASLKVDLASLRGIDAHRVADDDLYAHLQELDAEASGQAMSTEQLADFEETVTERTALAGVIEQLEIRDSVIKTASAEKSGRVEAPVTGFAGINVRRTPENIYDLAAYRQRANSVDDLPALYREGATRALDLADFPTAADPAKARAAVAKLLARHGTEANGDISRRVIATSSQAYIEAWSQAMKGLPLSGKMQAVLQTYVDADGGYAIPITIDPSFINTSDGSVNPLRALARIETITTKAWQAVTTGGVTAAYIGERTTTGAADSAPSDFAGPTATPVRADVALDVSLEYLQDYGSAALLSEIGGLINVAKDDLEADKFVMGDGSGEPEGIVYALITDTTSIVPTITNDVFALADIDKLIASLPPRFRARGAMMANLAILQLVPAFGTAGQPGNSVYDAIAKTLRGYPIYESSAMDDVATDAKEIILFGDFKAGFVIVDRVGLTTKVLDARDTNGRPTGGSTIYASWRNTSKLLFPNAFRLLKVQ